MSPERIMATRLHKVSCACLLVLLGGASACAQPRTTYYALFVAGKKLGHAAQIREVSGRKVTHTVDMTVSLARMGTPMAFRQIEQSVETTDGKPLAFKGVLEMGAGRQVTEGTVGADGKVEVTVTAGGKKSQRTLTWPQGALLNEGIELLTRRKGLKPGTRYQAKIFMATLLMAADADVVVGQAKDVDLLGRIVRLTEVTTTIKAPTGSMKSVSYVDEKANTLKTIQLAFGMQLEMVACSKAFALSKNDVVDFLDRFIVPCPRRLEGVAAAKAVTYRIEPTTKQAKLKFLTAPGQTVKRSGGRALTVTVSPVAAPAGEAFPYKGADAAARKALKPTRYLQSDDKEIVALARKAVGDAAGAAEAVRRIEKFVGEYIRSKNLDVGYATAVEVARSRQGDCTEHAVLAAALCRAVGIPAQVVTGMVYLRRFGTKSDVFVAHAWFRAYLGGKWVDRDATIGYHAGHIATSAGDGNPEDFFGELGTLGQFKITSVRMRK